MNSGPSHPSLFDDARRAICTVMPSLLRSCFASVARGVQQQLRARNCYCSAWRRRGTRGQSDRDARAQNAEAVLFARGDTLSMCRVTLFRDRLLLCSAYCDTVHFLLYVCSSTVSAVQLYHAISILHVLVSR